MDGHRCKWGCKNQSWVMKILLFYFFGLIAAGCAAQSQGTKQIDALERRALSKKKMIIRFEKVDTIDEIGRHLEVSRSYYFDRDRKNLLLITVNEKQSWPHSGFRLWYTFSDNKLVKITTIPSKMVCRRCNAEYYFSNDSLIYKNELNYSVKNIFSFLGDSKRVSSKVLNTMQ
jgi:hypothetical protein